MKKTILGLYIEHWVFFVWWGIGMILSFIVFDIWWIWTIFWITGVIGLLIVGTYRVKNNKF